MGGIVGIQYRNVGFPREGDIIDRMLAKIHHRGDASITQWCAPNVFLGATYHKDAQSKKHTVAFNASKKLCVVFDGALFFRDCDDSPDADVLLSLYETQQADLLSDVDGSYALAVWDGQDGNLLLVRDRVGCKPLFYLVLPDVIIFASEIKAILASGLYKPSVNLRAMNNFLSYGYIPAPDTLFDSIRQVRPGHILICMDGNVVEKPYWKFTYRQDEPDNADAFYKERFLEIFEAAVSRRLKRHPDAGAFLSGGLDTSGAVAVMRKLKGAPFKVFTAGFEEEKYNEIGDARIVADYLGLEHHTVTVKFDKDFPALLEKLVGHHDAPFADTSAIPSYYAAMLAKEYVDTVLTGDFPDQLIGGSGHHVHALYRESYDPAWKKMLRNKRLNEFIGRLRWRAGGSALSDRAKRFMYRETFSLEEQRILLGVCRT